MSEEFFKVPNNKSECEYIGFNLQKDTPVFMFPCQYLDETELDDASKIGTFRREAKKIITLLKHIQQEYAFGGSSGQLPQFYSMLWLIQDFVDHGYYIETEPIYKQCGSGKINWKKTIGQNKIYFQDGNVIFPNFVRNKNITDDSRIITQIYKACLAYSVARLGFIYGIEQTEPSVFDITSGDKGYIVYFLSNELNNTNRDYKKTLLRHLLAIVNNQNSLTQDIGYSIYDSQFEYVFEFLVNKVFGTENEKNFRNTYSYHMPPNVFAASKLRPDTIIKDSDSQTFYIVDAKYYNYGYALGKKDLPQSADISKQIGYNHYLNDNMPENEKKLDYKVKSIFVLPYASKVKGEYVKCLGYAQRDNYTYDAATHKVDDRVAVCLVDLKQLIDTYLTHSKQLDATTLIKSLNNC